MNSFFERGLIKKATKTQKELSDIIRECKMGGISCSIKYSQFGEVEFVFIHDEVCLSEKIPVEECIYCQGSACRKCGVDWWTNYSGIYCDHDVVDRHFFKEDI